jgi:copper resistance protein B
MKKTRLSIFLSGLILLLPISAIAQEVDHSKMDHSKMQMPATESTSKPKAPESDPHAGHAMPQKSPKKEMDHAAIGHTPKKSSDQPHEPIPTLTPADRAAAFPDVGNHPAHDNTIQSFVLINRLETWDTDAGTGAAWEGQGWIGTDLNRFWVRSEGARLSGKTESANVELLYGRSISAWWDVVAGIRSDIEPGTSEHFAVVGIMGLAPYKYEIEATAYLAESGQAAARLEAEYDLLLTNRLILQPLLEMNLYGKDDADRGIGSGLSSVEAGLRLRYEVRREFAPYVGVQWEKAFGSTADFMRTAGKSANDREWVIGVRIWF